LRSGDAFGQRASFFDFFTTSLPFAAAVFALTGGTGRVGTTITFFGTGLAAGLEATLVCFDSATGAFGAALATFGAGRATLGATLAGFAVELTILGAGAATFGAGAATFGAGAATFRAGGATFGAAATGLVAFFTGFRTTGSFAGRIGMGGNVTSS
jgi:hypothetical protein